MKKQNLNLPCVDIFTPAPHLGSGHRSAYAHLFWEVARMFRGCVYIISYTVPCQCTWRYIPGWEMMSSRAAGEGWHHFAAGNISSCTLARNRITNLLYCKVLDLSMQNFPTVRALPLYSVVTVTTKEALTGTLFKCLFWDYYWIERYSVTIYFLS